MNIPGAGNVRLHYQRTEGAVDEAVWDAFMNPLPRASTYTSGGV
jgi:hypothetical protein